MKRYSGLVLLLTLLLLLSACGAPAPSSDENGQAASGGEAASTDSEDEQSDDEEGPVQSFAAADIQGIDPFNPNLSVSDVDYSQQPHFTSAEGMDAFWRDCIANRYRSIVFSCDKSVQVDINAQSFCEDYLVAWVIPKMQPGDNGKQYVLRITYYPGDNVAWAYRSGDTSSLEPEELELYDAAAAWLAENISEDMTDYEKCVAIHDYLSGNVRYDNELLAALNTSFTFDWGITAYGAMVDNNSICQGYADAFVMLTTMLDIHSTQIYGTGSGEPHNWNLVELDGQWYHVDCTFDAAFGGTDGTSSKAYLFASDAQMRRTHSWETDRYPAAEDDSLYYYTAMGLVVGSEAELESKAAEAFQQGEAVNLYVKGVTKKQATDCLQGLGAQFHAAEYLSDVVICAWLPRAE